MEMEKSYYVVTSRPAYAELLRSQPAAQGSTAPDAPHRPQRFVVAITQGGFGQDVVDDERQAKERFLEYLFEWSAIDLPRSEEAFDRLFELNQADEYIDLDQEA